MAPGAGPGEGGGRGHGPALQPGQGCRGRSAGGAGPADQGGIEDLAGAVLVTAKVRVWDFIKGLGLRQI